MLVLTRKVGERIRIGDNITVVVTKSVGNRVTLGIEAPRDVRIVRGELEAIVESFQDEPSEPADQTRPETAPTCVTFAPADTCTFVPPQAR